MLLMLLVPMRLLGGGRNDGAREDSEVAEKRMI